jgi:hypothetical protein
MVPVLEELFLLTEQDKKAINIIIGVVKTNFMVSNYILRYFVFVTMHKPIILQPWKMKLISWLTSCNCNHILRGAFFGRPIGLIYISLLPGKKITQVPGVHSALLFFFLSRPVIFLLSIVSGVMNVGIFTVDNHCWCINYHRRVVIHAFDWEIGYRKARFFSM